MANYKLHRRQLTKLNLTWSIMIFIIISTASFIIYDWRFYLANLSVTFTLGYLTSISYKELIKAINGYLYLLIIIFSTHLIGGDWMDGLKIILRCANIATFAAWILLTTSHSGIMEGIESLVKPLCYFGLKPAKVSLATTLVVRFIPLIVDIFNQAKMAQKARGIDKNFGIIFVPCIIQIIKTADNISEAIETRS